MNNVEKIKPTGLFTNYIYKAIPLAFDESMSYYETLLGLLSYLKNTVIPALNNNADAIIEVQNLMTELQNYVDNYFTNLDVQEEINNKLDEMAQSGTLQNIIAEFLKLNSLITFNNVEDMKNSNNLIDGSFAQTLGFYNINDGGKALYKIKKITNHDIIDNMTIIALNDKNLIAELIFDDVLNVKQIGAKTNIKESSSDILEKAIEITKGKTLYFPEGIYYISSPIKTYQSTANFNNLIFDKKAIIKPLNQLNYLLDIGGIEEVFDYEVGNKKFITGGIFDASENVSISAIKIEQNIKDLQFENSQIYSNCNGIICGDNLSSSQDLYINHVIIKHTNIENEHSGIIINSNDNSLSNIRVYYNQKAIVVNGESNYLNDIHTLANNLQNNSIGIEINRQVIFISNSYIDSEDIAFKINFEGCYFNLTNCCYYSYRYNKMIAIDIKSYARLYITNFKINCKTLNDNEKHIGIKLPFKYLPSQLSKAYSVIKGLGIEYSENMRDGDILKGFMNSDCNIPNFYSQYYISSNNNDIMEKDKWYYIGSFPCDNKILKNIEFIASNRKSYYPINIYCNSFGEINSDIGSGNADTDDSSSYMLGYNLINPDFDSNEDYPIISLFLKNTSSLTRYLQYFKLKSMYNVPISNTSNRPTSNLKVYEGEVNNTFIIEGNTKKITKN